MTRGGLARAVAVDRSSPVPLYFQLAQALEAAIASGAIPARTRLDNEVALAGELGVSRPTLRRALEELAHKGLIVRRRGQGTHVVPTRVRRSLTTISLHDDLVRAGQRPATRVLSLDVVPAPDVVADRLGLVARAPVLRIERLRLAGGSPVAKLLNYLPDGLVEPDVARLETESLYQLYRAAGVVLHAAWQAVGARSATAEEARLLLEEPGAALLTVTRQTYDDRGRVVEYASHLYAASRYTVELGLLNG